MKTMQALVVLMCFSLYTGTSLGEDHMQSSADCKLWLCSCQGFSNVFNTCPSHWGSASTHEHQRWWTAHACTTNPLRDEFHIEHADPHPQTTVKYHSSCGKWMTQHTRSSDRMPCGHETGEVDTIKARLREGPSRTPQFLVDLQSWESNESAAPCQHWAAKPSSKPRQLKKTVFSGPKFIWVAGLEGTGHHLMSMLWQWCSRCSSAESFGSTPLFCTSPTKISLQSLPMAGSFDRLSQNYHTARRTIQTMLDHAFTHPESVFVLNTHCSKCCKCGMQSYPNFRQGCKRWQFPDMRVMAEIFEEFGIDFRILVLDRSALNLMLANVVHRKFGSWTALSKMYSDILNNHMLDEQLERLDPMFYACMDFDGLPRIQTNLDSFLGFPELAHALANVYVSHNASDANHVKEIERELFVHEGGRGSDLDNLKTAVSRMRLLCSKSPTTQGFDNVAMDRRDNELQQKHSRR
eukprot:m.9514 g.9514  ORF g.9514 m.9514 type:complete len:464 (+) comp7785_c0_seq1:300-1691(+)